MNNTKLIFYSLLCLLVIFMIIPACTTPGRSGGGGGGGDDGDGAGKESNPYIDGRIFKILASTDISLDTTNKPGTAIIKVGLNKPNVEINQCSIELVSAFGSRINSFDLNFNNASGFFEGTAKFEDYHYSGIWHIRYIYINDIDNNNWNYEIIKEYSKNYYILHYNNNDNSISYYSVVTNFLIGSGINVSTTTSDENYPVITSAELLPLTILSNGGNITIKISANDLGSGIVNCAGGLSIKAGNSWLCKSMSLIPNGGKFEGIITMNPEDESGLWRIDDIIIKDKAGNKTYYKISYNDNTEFYYVSYNNGEDSLSNIKIPSGVTKEK